MTNKAKLKIRSSNGITSGSEIFLNDQPFPVRNIILEGDAKGVWLVKAEFFISELDVDIELNKAIIDTGSFRNVTGRNEG